MPNGRPSSAIRLRTNSKSISFHDQIYGHRQQNIEREVGDFILKRTDGLYAYQLVVVVDDAHQGITHIVRGADLLSSTHRQIYLQNLLELPHQEYAHLPLVLEQNGSKLSKSSHSHPVDKNNPLPTLKAAWRFLMHSDPELGICQLDEFWLWAIANWNLKKIVPKEPLSLVVVS